MRGAINPPVGLQIKGRGTSLVPQSLSVTKLLADEARLASSATPRPPILVKKVGKGTNAAGTAPVLARPSPLRPAPPPISEPEAVVSSILPKPASPEVVEPVEKSNKLSLNRMGKPYWVKSNGCLEPVYRDGRLIGATCTWCIPSVFVPGGGGRSYTIHWSKHAGGTVPVPEVPPASANVSTISAAEKWRKERALAVFMMKTHQPLSLPSNPAMEDFVREWQPGLNLSSWPTIVKHHLLPLYNTFSVSRLEGIRGQTKFSITYDVWKAPKSAGSQNHRAYLGIALFGAAKSYVNQLLHVAVRRLRNHHDSTAILAEIRALLSSLRLPFEDVICSHSDNAKAEVNVGEALVSLGSRHHTHCWCHTAHLSVLDVLKGVPCCRLIYKFCKKLLKIFAHHRLLCDILETAQREQRDVVAHHLLNDCKTRWYSAYAMMERVHEQWSAIRTVLGSVAAARVCTTKKRSYLRGLLSDGTTLVRDIPFLLVILNHVRRTSVALEGVNAYASEALYLQDGLELNLKVRTRLQCQWVSNRVVPGCAQASPADVIREAVEKFKASSFLATSATLPRRSAMPFQMYSAP